MQRDIENDEYAALAAIRYEIRRFVTFSEGMARDAGIEPQQHQLLLALRGLPDGDRPTIGVLAKRLLIRHNSAVELVTRSVDAGLLRRVPGQHDRREVTLVLTARGEKLLATLSIAHREELRSAAPVLLHALAEILGPGRKRSTRKKTR